VSEPGLLEAAGMPHRMEGRLLPSDIPGKENRSTAGRWTWSALISPRGLPDVLDPTERWPQRWRWQTRSTQGSSNTPVTALYWRRSSRRPGYPRACSASWSFLVGHGNVLVGQTSRGWVSSPVERTGLHISRRAGIKKLLFRTRGNAPLIVMDDADLDAAVDSRCSAPSNNSDRSA